MLLVAECQRNVGCHCLQAGLQEQPYYLFKPPVVLLSLQKARRVGGFLTSLDRTVHKVGASIEKVCAISLHGSSFSSPALSPLSMFDSQTQIEAEKQKIRSAFEQMHKFLDEQEHLRLSQLKGLEKVIGKQIKENIDRLSEEISRLSRLISEMDRKCKQPATEFLQVGLCLEQRNIRFWEW